MDTYPCSTCSSAETDKLLDRYIIQRNIRQVLYLRNTQPIRPLRALGCRAATTRHQQHSTMALKSVAFLDFMSTRYLDMFRSKLNILSPELHWTNRSQTDPGPSPTNWPTRSGSRLSMSQSQGIFSHSLSRVVCVGKACDCSIPRALSRFAV